MDEVAQGLTVDPDAMQANMDATEGAVLAERATFLLAESMGTAGPAGCCNKKDEYLHDYSSLWYAYGCRAIFMPSAVMSMNGHANLAALSAAAMLGGPSM